MKPTDCLILLCTCGGDYNKSGVSLYPDAKCCVLYSYIIVVVMSCTLLLIFCIVSTCSYIMIVNILYCVNM